MASSPTGVFQWAQVAELGPLTTLVTVTPEGLPHIGSVLVTAMDDEISVRVGRRTRDNLLAHQLRHPPPTRRETGCGAHPARRWSETDSGRFLYTNDESDGPEE
jgi:hypothetical protein